MTRRRCLLLAAALAAVPWSVSAQELSLSEALARAEHGGYGNRIAAGASTEASAGPIAALQGVLPSLRIEGGYARTTDPIGAFGITLRQRRIAPPDFDPARLNYPDATTNYTGAVVVEQPLFNADAYLGRSAARHAAAAGEASERWTRIGTRVEVIRAYYGAVLARERVGTLEAAVRAARAHVEQAEAMVRNGVVTRSDALLAAVRSGEIEAQRIEAEGEAHLARRQLAVVLGTPADTGFSLPTAFPGTEAIVAIDEHAAAGAVEARPDVQAARAGMAAAHSDVRRARSLALPRLNAIARYDWNSPDAPYGGDENWTVGVIASWAPFTGAAQVAELRATRGREAAARAGAEAAYAQARLEAEQADVRWSVALERLAIAAGAVAQSVEAHRIVSRRYEGGLATVIELLSAAATETEARLRLSNARYQAVVAAAERLRAHGHDPATLTILDGRFER